MHKVLVVMDVLKEHKEVLESVSSELDFRYKSRNDLTPSDVKDVEIIIGNLEPKLLKFCENLKLLQLNNAGTEGFTAEGVIPDGAILTNASGAYGLAISEHMIASLMCLMKKLDLYKLNQEKHLWKDEGPVKAIYGSKTLVVGFGDIGSEFALRMNALGSEVKAIRKNILSKPDYIKSLHTMDDFYACLKEADIVATCLPGNSETQNVFDSNAFSNMKDGAYLINVGRGSAIDTDALCEALISGKIGGAILDVTSPEPLPEDHKLWDMPNVLLTPHVSGGYHVKATHDRIIEIAARNLKHFILGEAFENIVDMKTGYRKSV